MIPLSKVDNHPLAQEIMGKGVAVFPFAGKAVAPFAGKVVKTFNGNHCLIIEDTQQKRILIHIGINSKSASQSAFKLHTATGKSFKKGDTLISFDIPALKKQDIDPTSLIIFMDDNWTFFQQTEVNFSTKLAQEV